MLEVANVYDERRIRRVGWLLDIVKHPEDNVQLRAALGGDLYVRGSARGI